MADNKGSRFATEQEAILATPGLVYRHYKGGIYRFLYANVKNTETGGIGVVYEHIWPYAHSVLWRPTAEFFGKLDDGRPRFELLEEVINLGAHVPIAPATES